MKNKILAVLLSFAMLSTAGFATTPVGAAEVDSVSFNSETVPNWTVTGSGTVTREYDSTTDNHYVRFVCAGWGREMIKYAIPSGVINTEHQYSVVWYAKANDGATDWNGLEFEAGTVHCLDTWYFNNYKSGSQLVANVTFESADGQKIAFGSYGAGKGDWSIDDVALYDNTVDAEHTTNLLVNGDFEGGAIVEVADADNMPNWTVQSGVYRIYNPITKAYKVNFKCGAWGRERLAYSLSSGLIDTTHTYMVKWYAKANSGTTDCNGLEFEAGTTHYTDHWYFANFKNGSEMAANINFASTDGQKIAFGSYGTGNGDWEISNVRLYDTTLDSECTNNLLVNGDFSYTADTIPIPDTYFAGWTRSSQDETDYSYLSKNATYGNVANIIKNTTGDNSVGISQTIDGAKFVVGNTYALTCNYKASSDDDNAYVKVVVGEDEYTPYCDGEWTALTDEDYTFTYASGDVKIGFYCDYEGSATELDVANISVHTVGSTDNIIDNGDFSATIVEKIYPGSLKMFPGWISPDVNFNNGNGDKVERYYNRARASWEAKLTQKSGSTRWQMFTCQVPVGKVIAGHTYNVSWYARCEDTGADNWYYYSCGNKNGNRYTKNALSGGREAISEVSFDSTKYIYFGFTKSANAIMYLDDLVVYDEADESKTNIIKNSGFEITVDDLYEDGNWETLPGWTSPEGFFATSSSSDVQRYFNISRDSYEAKINYAGGNAAWNALRYTIPSQKLNYDHKYTLKAYARCDDTGAENWFSFGGGDINRGSHNYYTKNQTNGGTIAISDITFTDSTNYISVGFNGTGKSVLYFDNVVLTDQDDASSLNLIESGDFETTYADYTTNGSSKSMPYWGSFDGAFDNGKGDTTDVVYDLTTASKVARLKHTSGQSAWNMLYYTIDATKIDTNKTYTLSWYARCEDLSENYYYINVGGTEITRYTPNSTTGGTESQVDVVFNENTIDNGAYNIYFGFTAKTDAVLYLDNICLYDNEDEDLTNMISNSYFESFSADLIETDVITASVLNPIDALDGMLAVASYVDGKQYDVNVQVFKMEASDTTQEITCALPSVPSEGAYTLKAFLWNDNSNPLVLPLVISK